MADNLKGFINTAGTSNSKAIFIAFFYYRSSGNALKDRRFLKLTFGSNCKNAVSSQPIFLHFQTSKYYVTRLETIPGSQ